MRHLHDEIRVEAPVEHVWKFYCDTSHWQDWMPRVTSLEFDGPVDKVGTKYSGTSKVMGFEMKGTYEIVEVEPLKLIHEHTDWGPMDNYMRFEPEGETTRIVIDSDWEMPGKLPGFLKDIASKGWVERNTHQMLEDFKALAETKIPEQA